MSSRGISLMRIGVLTLVTGMLAMAMTLGVSTGFALAESDIGSPGSGAGQLSEPHGVAVDREDDLLYVADTGNDRIAVFDASTGAFIRAFGWGVADGTTNALQVCTTTCFKGIGGAGAGQLDRAVGIAVDNQSDSPNHHAVYVFESSGTNVRVQQFTPAGEFVWMVGGKVNKTTEANLCTAASGNSCGAGVPGDGEGFFNQPGNGVGGVAAVGPGGTVYVADQLEGVSPRPTRVQKFSPAGVHLGQLLLSVPGGSGKATGLGVDSLGNLYVGTSGTTGAVRKYSAAGVEQWTRNPSLNVAAVAMGPEDHVFVADNSNQRSAILEYDASGTLLRVFYGSLVERAVGLAPYPPTPLGDIFAAEPSGKQRVVAVDFPGPGPVVYPGLSTIFAGPIGNTKATLNVEINPEGEATTYHFEYISDEDFDAAGGSFGAGTMKTPESPSIGSDFTLHKVQTQITGLFPETEYHFRAVAKNASGEDVGPEATFITKEPVEFGDHWTTDVGLQSATLHAEVNPLGIPSTARFQYTELADTSYANAKEAPASPIDLGDGEEPVEASTPVSGLEEGTVYRYRLVVTNRCKPEPEPLCDFAEAEGTFTTFVTLEPDIDCSNAALRAAGSGTFLPDCRAYEMVSPIDKEGANIEAVFNNFDFPASLDQAAVNGDSVTYSAYKAFGDATSAPYTDQYLARRDRTSGWESEAISPKREGPSLMTYESSQLDRQYKVFSDDLCSGWVVQDANPTLAPEGIEGFPGLYRRANCGGEAGSYEALTTVEPPNLAPRKFIPEPQGVSDDGSVTIFTVKDNLTPDAPPQPEACVNETSPSAEPCLRRLYEAREGQLEYVCILPGETPFTGACSAGQTSSIEPWKGRANLLDNVISGDGSRIFWTAASSGPGPLYVRIDGSQPSAETVQVSSSNETKFWTAAADGSTAIYSVADKLFEFDVDSETATPIAEGLTGFVDAAEDASRIYFTSTKVLTGEEENSAGDKAEAGRPNLYLYEKGSGLVFVGTLASSDLGAGGPVFSVSGPRLSRATESGQQLVFMSYARITGYDNKDAVTGEPDMEVFLYDATANAGEGAVLCPSCNPSNARPVGRQMTQNFLTEKRAAGRIPPYVSHLYGQRVISEDGSRLYFNSFESLVSTDTNGKEDVYQWQKPGSGSCTTESPTYHEVSGGCVDLISSGKSPQDSELVDVSADGSDVFFKTFESLVTQDPGLRDIYDARVGGGFPPLPPKPVICQGEACPQPPTPAPLAVAPASQVQGPGNPVWPKQKPKPRKCPKGKHKVKKNGKVRCVKNKRGKQQGKKRAGANRGAAR
jgi:DNA-binding beta-propeller fold protein YncE